VLGSREQAEDVAQDVFLSFGRSPVPAGQARGWLSVAAAHTALNLLRSRRRRVSREEAATAVDDAVGSDVRWQRWRQHPERPMRPSAQAWGSLGTP